MLGSDGRLCGDAGREAVLVQCRRQRLQRGAAEGLARVGRARRQADHQTPEVVADRRPALAG